MFIEFIEKIWHFFIIAYILASILDALLSMVKYCICSRKETIALRIKEKLPSVDAAAIHVLVFYSAKDSTASRVYDALPGRRLIYERSGQHVDESTPLRHLRCEKIKAKAEDLHCSSMKE